MLVYRRVSEKELNNILKGNKECLGSFCTRNRDSNTHRYKKGVRYLHFFEKLEDISRIAQYHKMPTIYFICSFDIPKNILAKYKGKGKYDAGGYDYNIDSVTEFAINVDVFDCSWLKTYELDNFNMCKIQNER